MSKWCDRVVIGGLGFLILFSPLAFGSVHPWAFSLMEAMIFFLIVVWMARLVIAGSREQGAGSGGQRSDVSGQPFALSSLHFANKLALPLFLFFVFVLFQLLPLPPALLRLLSPSTFELYTRTLPGWPDGAPYAALEPGKEQSGREQRAGSSEQGAEDSASRLTPSPSRLPPSAPVILPTPDEVRSGAPVPFEQGAVSSEQGAEGGASRLTPYVSRPAPDASHLTLHVFPATWFPLSLAPSQTWSDFLKLASYAALFFLVLLHPFAEVRGRRAEVRGLRPGSRVQGAGRSGEREQRSGVAGPRAEVNGPWLRVLWVVILFSGLIVAAVGFIQRFTWNGKILWFFIPYDWEFARPGGDPRASGPFINPDHFANYLALILPLALGFIIQSRNIFTKDSQLAAKIFAGLTTFVAVAAILLSLSRVGWMSAVLGTALLLWLSPRSEAQTPIRDTAGKRLALRGSLLLVSVLLIVGLFFVGPGGREQVDARLQETVAQDPGIAGRSAVWNDTLRMVRDFPFLGVGLGSWPDLFQRYRSVPWSPEFYREAHNDYLELLAETGVIGFLFLLLFFFRAGKRVSSYFRLASNNAGAKALVAMLLAALGTMTFHEFFDFNLQIPANALLFTLLLAIAVRIAANMQSAKSGAQSAEVSSRPHAPRSMLFRHASRLTPYGVCALSLFLIAAAFRQEMTPYPYNLKMPGTIAEANAMILAHPALSTPHIYLLRSVEEKMPLEWRQNELRAALWLNPNDPYTRDLYAQSLLRAGKKTEAFREVTQSVFNAPILSVHYYLSGRFLLWLSAEEIQAVESGFKKALALEYPDTVESFAGFYEGIGRFSDRGKLFEEEALRSRNAAAQADFSIRAALSYLTAGDDHRAEALLRTAASLAPKDVRSYQILATMIYGPRKEIDKINQIISEGIKSGAPSYALYLSLAEAMHKAGALDETKKALALAKDAIQRASGEGQEPSRLYYSLADTAQRLNFREESKSALLQALEFRPSASDILGRLGHLYLEENNFDRSAYYFRRYLELNPDADAFYYLGLAEEGQYRFAAAETAYKRAIELGPQNEGYRRRYEGFKARVAQNGKPNG